LNEVIKQLEKRDEMSMKLAYILEADLFKQFKDYGGDAQTWASLWHPKGDPLDVVIDNLDLDGVKKSDVDKLKKKIEAITKKSIAKYDDPITVYRTGSLSDPVVSVSLTQRSTFGKQTKYTVPKKAVIMNTNAVLGTTAQYELETELLVWSKYLKKKK